MSHKDAPPLLPEQIRMEAFYRENAVRFGVGTIGFGRNKYGEYHAEFAKLAWAAWQEARCAP